LQTLAEHSRLLSPCTACTHSVIYLNFWY